MLFRKIGIRNGYGFEASMARPRPKSGQVHWSVRLSADLLSLPLVPCDCVAMDVCAFL